MTAGRISWRGLPCALGLIVCATTARADMPAAPPTAPPDAAPTAGVSSGAVDGPPPASIDASFSDGLRAYHAALLARRLGQDVLRPEDVGARVAAAEAWIATGRVDEAIASLAELVEHPGFDRFADTEEGRAALFRLGDALATAGVAAPARAYLRRLLAGRDVWKGYGSAAVWARRAVRRLVDIALDAEAYDDIAADLATVPDHAPEEVRGEIAYVNGRAREAHGDRAAAVAAYAAVGPRSRFWAQATYLAALLAVERGDYKRGEDLLCRVADPKRSAATTPVFADEKFFAVRDLARLGLGRIAHEEGRNDDARYYYYLVPQDSDRLAEALYEAATTRYEKKDYDGARNLIDELATLGIHHRYEDEAWVLGAWIDLARCRFEDADQMLRGFLTRYEPVREAARRIAENDAAMPRLLAAAHAGMDAAGAGPEGVDPEAMRTVAALLRVDPSYERVTRRRVALEREDAGLAVASSALVTMQSALATNGGVRPTSPSVPNAGSGSGAPDPARRRLGTRESMDGLEHEIADIAAAHAPADVVAPLQSRLSELRQRLDSTRAASVAQAESPGADRGADLPDLLGRDLAVIASLRERVARMREQFDASELALAKNALRRLDLRLSRLLRRARLGRIETVLGRKRALEGEVEAIRLGYLPHDAVDSLDAARYLEDSEEYWPFEGDDWPDEYVGGEVQ